MRLIIHDLNEQYNDKIAEMLGSDGNDIHIISDNGTIKQCLGCFGCWIKTPGQCVLNDNYNQMGALGGRAEELIIISKCFYGTYSPFVRNVLDRCLPYMHPDFTKRNNEIHHKVRYLNRMNTKVYFYGDATNGEKETANKMVKANVVNFNGIVDTIKFLEDEGDVLSGSSIN